MTKNFILNILICFLFLVSCNQKKNTKLQTDEKSEKSANVDEDFATFLKAFSQDSTFQIGRVKFPLKIKEWVDPELGMLEKTITKMNYEKLDFTYPADATTRKYDRYTQKINIGKNKCIVEIRGIDNGISSDFVFEKINAKWTLISWSERST